MAVITFLLVTISIGIIVTILLLAAVLGRIDGLIEATASNLIRGKN